MILYSDFKNFAFQSTPSAWRETVYHGTGFFQFIVHFNPLPPHGGRPLSDLAPGEYLSISIHSLRMEGDR